MARILAVAALPIPLDLSRLCASSGRAHLRYFWDEDYYTSRYPDVLNSRISPLVHYLAHGAVEGRHPGPLFDTSFYRDRYDDVRRARLNPLLHFVRFGYEEGRCPHPLFDDRFYADQLSVLDTAPRTRGFRHYIETGSETGRKPNPLFDPEYYRAQYFSVGEAHLEPLAHYIGWGEGLGLKPHPLFDPEYLRSQIGAVETGEVTLLEQYLLLRIDQSTQPHPLFDGQHYLALSADARASGLSALVHYLLAGSSIGLQPHPLFDPEHYRSECTAAGVSWSEESSEPLTRFLEFGLDEKANPHPLFDVGYYLEQNPALRAERINPLVHYIRYGDRAGCDPHPLFHRWFYLDHCPEARLACCTALEHFLSVSGRSAVSPSPLFDVEFYRDTYCDVAESSLNPLVHWATCGWRECRHPNPLFDTGFYLDECCSEVEGDPLVHFLIHGASEDRWANRLFDPEYYRSQVPVEDRFGLNELAHFLLIGAQERFKPHPLFDCGFYLDRYPDVAAAGVNPLVHYLTVGGAEGRDPSPLFSTDFYASQAPSISLGDHCPLVHYVTEGAGQGRDPHPLFDTSFYLEQGADTGRHRDPFSHYLRQGWKDGRDPNPLFSTRDYVARHVRLLQGDLSPIEHCLRNGISRRVVERGFGWSPNPGEDPACRAVQEEQLRRLHRRPLISVLMPAYNTPPAYLDLAIESVRNQVYPEWELCIVDDASSSSATVEYLANVTDREERIHYRRLPQNGGISSATNAALELAGGEFIAMLDHDDVLLPTALLEVAAELNRFPETDVLYTDQMTVEEDGRPAWTLRKPDWSPELFRGVMYVGHLLVVKRRLAQTVGGFDSRWDGVQDFEFMLRLSERTDRIRHIPKVLYHWRKVPGSLASGPNEKNGIHAQQADAVRSHLERVGVRASVEPIARFPHRVLCGPRPDDPLPTLSLLVGAGCSQETLGRMLDTFSADELDSIIEILLVHRKGPIDSSATLGSVHSSNGCLTKEISLDDRRSLAALAGEYLVWLSSGTESVSPNTLRRLTYYARMPDVAFASPSILSDRDRIVNAGLAFGREQGGVIELYNGCEPDGEGYAGALCCPREVSLVSGHAFAIGTAKLRQLGFPKPFYDAVAMRFAHVAAVAHVRGFRNICDPQSRVTLAAQDEQALGDRMLFANYWNHRLGARDPYLHEGLRPAKHGESWIQ